MARLPKPLIGLLLGTVAFFAIWMVALKPSSSSSSGGAGQYQPAINAAHGAVTTSNQANAKLGAPTATAPAPKPATPATTTPVTAAKPSGAVKSAHAVEPAQSAEAAKAAHAAKPTTAAAPSAAAEVAIVRSAIADHKVLAVLFYNPAAADDQAMKSELAALPSRGATVVRVAVPVAELSKFGMVTQQVPVVTAPTLVLIDAARQATTITGFADQLEISQRIDNALAAK